MTQNASDVEIANQGFAAFRQDLNDVLEDITTLHSGDTAPTTTYANQFWYETDTDKLYIRNEDNDAWIEILTLDQANDKIASLTTSALTVEDDSAEALAAAREHWPTAFFKPMKAGSMPGILEDGVYIAFPQVVFTHAGVSDDVVYAMAKAMYEGKEDMVATFRPFGAFNPNDMRGDPGIAEFHPGALKFFADNGL